MPLGSDVWISEAAFERLAPGRYIARVKVETPDETRIDMFALAPESSPNDPAVRRHVADWLRDYYLKEGI